MAKIRFTKGELKRQRDALKQYRRYLPILQLKKQQLQMEILRQATLLEQRSAAEAARSEEARAWVGLLTTGSIDLRPWITARAVDKTSRNIAGVDLPVFERARFDHAKYDLFLAPLWIDAAIDALRSIVSLREEVRVIEEGMTLLRNELRVTTQRVNLFEKIKIPEAEEAIRVIKIYMGDQMANAVGRSKIAKRKIETALAGEPA